MFRKHISREEAEKIWPPRNDIPSFAMRAIVKEDGLCSFEDGTVVDTQCPIQEDNECIPLP